MIVILFSIYLRSHPHWNSNHILSFNLVEKVNLIFDYLLFQSDFKYEQYIVDEMIIPFLSFPFCF